MARRWASWSATTVSVVMAVSVLGTAQATAQDDGFDFEPLLMPFPAGDGVVVSGYLDRDNQWHQSQGNKYSLDFCEGAGCTVGEANVDKVVAPTDLSLVESYSYDGVDGNPEDYHVFLFAQAGEDRLCLALGHFDLTAPSDDAGELKRGTVLGTLMPYYGRPHIHIGLWTVTDTRCDDSDPAERLAVAFEDEYALDGQSFPVTETDAVQSGRAVTSTNGVLADPDAPGATRIAQWIEPAAGAKVGPKLTLSAWPTPVLLNDELTDDPTTARVDFYVLVDGEQAPACSAKKADDTGAWSCRANLLDLGAKEGKLELSFDVIRTDGGATPSPGGVQTVRFVSPPTDPTKYLRYGIPTDVRTTCKKRNGTMPPGTIAALDCKPDAAAIDTISYFLMRPDDARATWQERMAQYGLRKGGNCAKGKAGIESAKRARSIGCYKNEQGYANLRLASSRECPSIYVGVLGNTKDIARLWKAYDRVAGEGWDDPGLGGRKDAPGCSGRIPAVAPPGPPVDVTARVDDPSSMTRAMRQACKRDGHSLTAEIGYCLATHLRWKPARGRVDRYEVQWVGFCPVAGTRNKMEWRRETVARISRSGPYSHIYTTAAAGVELCDSHLEVAAVNGAGETRATPTR